MAKIIINVSISLDGFVAGPTPSAEDALGVGGERLHVWLFNRNHRRSEDMSPNEVDVTMSREAHETAGAIILGRRTFGMQHWQDTPYPAPSFVLTRRLN